MSIDRAATGYTLLATTGSSLTPSTSQTFDITPGAATGVVFRQQPRNTPPSTTLAPSVKVQLVDAAGNFASSPSTAVSLALNPNPGSLSGGGAVVTDGSGTATFASLSVSLAANGYTLVATGVGLSNPNATSSAFNVQNAGAATKLFFTNQPTNTTAGKSIDAASSGVQVSVTDQNDIVVPSATNAITVQIGQNAGSPIPGTLSPSSLVTVNAVNGTAVFPNLSIDRAGFGYTLAASASGLLGAQSSNFQISAGAATQLSFAQQPTSTAPGATIRPAVGVQLLDALGNAASTPIVVVSLAIGANPGGGTLSGNSPQTTSGQGSAFFSNLSVNNVGAGYTLVASGGGLPNLTSSAFNIQAAGPASQLVFTLSPNSSSSGQPLNGGDVQVSVADAAGIIIPSETRSITVAIGNNPSGGVLGGTTTVAASTGTATFNNLTIDKSGFPYTLVASAGGLPAVTNATSNAFKVFPGNATQLVFQQQPANAAPNQAIVPAVTARLADAAGNFTNFPPTNVGLSLNVISGSGTLSGGNAVTTDTFGAATFANLQVSSTGTYTLSTTSALSNATSNSFNVQNAGPATQLAFSNQPTSTTAGQTINGSTGLVQVAAKDSNGIVDPTYNQSVTIAIGQNGGFPAGTLSGTTTVSAVNGIATFMVSIDKQGFPYTLVATSGALTQATSSQFGINGGSATQLAFVQQPTNTAPAPGTITPAVVVQLTDSFGNPTGGPATTVSLALGAGSPPGTLTGGGGQLTDGTGRATFSNLSVSTAGVGFTLVASGGALPTTTSSTFNVVAPGPATKLVFTASPFNTQAGQTIGAPTGVQVSVTDANGVVFPGRTDQITIAFGQNPAGGTITGATQVNAVNGTATFTLSVDKAANNYTFTASAAGLSGATSNFFSIFPGQATQLIFTQQPPNAAPNTTMVPPTVVNLADALGNPTALTQTTITLTKQSGPGNVTGGGGQLTDPQTGAATFAALSVDQAGTYTLLASGGGFTKVSSSFVIQAAGAASKLVFTNPPSNTTAGQKISGPTGVRVAVTDSLGIVVATDNSTQITLALKSNPTGATLNVASGTNPATVVNGVATFDVNLTKAGNGYTLRATSSPVLTAATSGSFDVFSGTPSDIAFFANPQNAGPGVTIPGQFGPIQVGFVDSFGNGTPPPSGGGETITVAIGNNPGTPTPGTLSGTTTKPASFGSAQFDDLSIDNTGTGYTLTATSSPSGFNTTSTSFDIQALKLVWIVQPGTYTQTAAVTAPKLLRPTVPVVQLQDLAGNPITNQSFNVTVTLLNGGAAVLSGGTNVGSFQGISKFYELLIDTVGSGYRLRATASNGAQSADTNTFNVVASDAWTRVSSAAITGGRPRALAIDNSTSPATVYAAQVDGIYVSTDGGTTWTNTTSNITDTSFANVVVDKNDNAVYVSAQHTGLWKSTSRGAAGSWTRLNLSVGSNAGIAATNVAGKLYVFSGNQVFVTTNGGTSWNNPGSSGLPSSSGGFSGTAPIAVSPSNSDVLFVGFGGSQAQVFRSIDGGVSFTSVSGTGGSALPSNDRVTCLAIDAGGTSLYAGTEGAGVFRATVASPNAWTAYGTGLTPNTPQVDALVVDPNSATTLYACCTNEDGGPGQSGVFKHTGGSPATAWASASNGLVIFAGAGISLVVDPSTGTPSQKLLVGLEGPGIFATTNAGGTWARSQAGTAGPEILDVVTDPGDDTVVYATLDNRLVKSTNGGTTFTLQTIPASVNFCGGVAVEPVTGAVYVGTDVGVLRGTRAGTTWTLNSGSPFTGLFPILPAVDAATGAVYVGGFAANGQLFRSTDGGVTFTPTNPTGLPAGSNVLQLLFDGTTLYAAIDVDPQTSAGIYRCTNLTTLAFTQMTGLGSNFQFDIGRCLAVDTVSSPHRIYFANSQGGVFRLNAGNTAFTNVTANLPPGNGASTVAFANLASPGPSMYVFSVDENGAASDDQGVWRTSDGGATWAPVTNGLRFDGRGNALGPSSDGMRIFAGTGSSGLYVTTTAGGP
ncbi:MAG: hypothetical protein ACAI25_14615 [Planctomycetota bacterium]